MTDGPEFLSEEWFAGLDARLSGAGPIEDPTGLRLGQVVTDVPRRGEVSWTILAAPGEPPRLARDAAGEEAGEVTLVSSYGAARSLAAGERTAADLLEAGELKIRGDARRLVAASALLSALATALGDG